MLFNELLLNLTPVALHQHLTISLHARSCTGSGFSGFWYHLGLLQSSPDLHNRDYYCYSSGCLSLVLAFWNTTLDDTFDACFQLQQAWLDGNITRYDLVNGFLDHFMSASTLDHMNILSRLHILVTTASTGVHIETATSLAELRDLLIKTTWIPYVTGEGILQQTQDYYLDGGFSRSLHPVCEQTLTVPLTWKTGLYTLDPSFEKSTAVEFWSMGQQARGSSSARMAVF